LNIISFIISHSRSKGECKNNCLQ